MSSTTSSESRVSRDRVSVHCSPGARTVHGSPELRLGLGVLCAAVGGALLLGLFPIRGSNAGIAAPFGAVFVVIGAWMAGSGLRYGARSAARALAPWRADGFTRPVLTAGIGHDHGRMALQALLCFGFAAYLITSSVPGSNPRFMGFIFLAAGFGTLLYMAWTQVRRSKFGNCRLIVRSIPTRPGERLQLVFRGGSRLSDCDITFRLQCVEQEHRASSRNSGGTVVAERRYEERHVLRSQPDGAVVLSFDLPADLPGTRMHVGSGAAAVYWRLLADADIPGLDYHGDFLLPIYGR